MVIAIRVSVILACLALISTPARAQKMDLARLAFSSGWDALPAIVALERGFFSQEGLVVSPLPIASREVLARSLVSGSTEFATISQQTLMVMVGAGVPIKIVGMNGWGREMELIAPSGGSEIGSFQDLRGKVVAVSVLSEAYPILVRALNAERVRLTEVTIRPLSPDRLLAAFGNGQADAIFDIRHFTKTVLETGGARRVLSNASVVELLGALSAQPLIVTDQMIADEPGTVQKFVNAWVKALVYIQQEPEDSAQLLRLFMNRRGSAVSDELANLWVRLTRFDRYGWSANDIADAEYNGWALKQLELLKEIPDLDPYVDNRFADAAWQALQ